MSKQEVLYYSNLQNGLGAVDLHTGGHISAFKQNGSPRNAVAVSQGSMRIVAAQTGKALIQVYSLTKESVFQKIVVPEHLTALAISPCENWLAAGGVSGRLYLWDLASGRLWFAKDCHYQQVTCLMFLSDSSALVSGSQDARIFVWRILDLVSDSELSGSGPANVSPVYTFSDHTLAVTHLCVGKGKFNEARLASCSADGTLRLYDLASGALLTTFVLPGAASSLVLDSAERAVYVGLESGDIVIVSLYERDASNFLQAVGGAASVVTVRQNPDTVLKHHTAAVTSLALSFDCMYLISGDAQGQLVKWDLSSNQLQTKYRLSAPSNTSITSIATVVRAKDIHKSRTDPEKLPQLKRTLGDEAHDVWINIGENAQETSFESDDEDEYETTNYNDEIRHNETFDFNFTSGTAPSKPSAVSEGRVAELEAELDSVHRHYNALREVHEDLWRKYVEATGNNTK